MRGQPIWPAVMAISTALTLALAARHGLIEPAQLSAACDASPWQSGLCAARTLTIEAFIGHRLAGVALGCGALALLTRWRWAALTSLAAGSAGLVLYSAGPCAPAVLLGALAWVRPGSARSPEASP